MNQLIDEYLWATALVVILLGGMIQVARAKALCERAEDYRRVVLPCIAFGVVMAAAPFAAMGMMLEMGLVERMEEFDKLWRGNTWVRLWCALWVLETIVLVVWITNLGGAAVLARYPFLMNGLRASERTIKLGVVLLVVVGWGFFAARSFAAN